MSTNQPTPNLPHPDSASYKKGPSRSPALTNAHSTILRVSSSLSAFGHELKARCIALYAGYRPSLSQLSDDDAAAVIELSADLDKALSKAPLLWRLEAKRSKLKREEKQLLNSSLHRLKGLEYDVALVLRDPKFPCRIKGFTLECRETLAAQHESAAKKIATPPKAPKPRKPRTSSDALKEAASLSADQADPNYPHHGKIADLKSELLDKPKDLLPIQRNSTEPSAPLQLTA